MNTEQETQIQRAGLLLFQELIFNLHNQVGFRPKLFRKKYGISMWEYNQAVKMLKDMGLIEVEKYRKPRLKQEVKEKIINATSVSFFNTHNGIKQITK